MSYLMNSLRGLASGRPDHPSSEQRIRRAERGALFRSLRETGAPAGSRARTRHSARTARMRWGRRGWMNDAAPVRWGRGRVEPPFRRAAEKRASSSTAPLLRPWPESGPHVFSRPGAQDWVASAASPALCFCGSWAQGLLICICRRGPALGLGPPPLPASALGRAISTVQ